MIKLLYKLFKRKFNKLIFEDQVKPDKFSSYKFAFVDAEGRRYYEPIELGNMGIERYADFQKCIGELGAAVSQSEIKLMKNTMTTARKKEDWDMITVLEKEIDLREKTIIPRNIFYDILSDYYVREDEDPEVIDHEIQESKVKYFMDNIQVLGFFLKNELMTELLGLPAMSVSQLNLILLNSEQRVKIYKEMLEKYQSQNESSGTSNNSESI